VTSVLRNRWPGRSRREECARSESFEPITKIDLMKELPALDGKIANLATAVEDGGALPPLVAS
jgi:hypothetical protein